MYKTKLLLAYHEPQKHKDADIKNTVRKITECLRIDRLAYQDVNVHNKHVLRKGRGGESILAKLFCNNTRASLRKEYFINLLVSLTHLNHKIAA